MPSIVLNIYPNIYSFNLAFTLLVIEVSMSVVRTLPGLLNSSTCRLRSEWRIVNFPPRLTNIHQLSAYMPERRVVLGHCSWGPFPSRSLVLPSLLPFLGAPLLIWNLDTNNQSLRILHVRWFTSMRMRLLIMNIQCTTNIQGIEVGITVLPTFWLIWTWTLQHAPLKVDLWMKKHTQWTHNSDSLRVERLWLQAEAD